MRSVLGLQFDGNAIFTCKNIMPKFLPQPSSSDIQLRARCCSSFSHSCVPWPTAWRHAAAWLALSRSGFSGHHCQKLLSRWREAVLSPPHATVLPGVCSPKSSGLCTVNCPTFPVSTIFHSPAALVLCVWLYYPAKREPVVICVAVWVCMTKQRRPVSLDPRSFWFPWGTTAEYFSF